MPVCTAPRQSLPSVSARLLHPYAWLQYLIQDLFFTTVLAALMGYTEPRTRLSAQRPLSRVMSMPLLVSTLLQLLVVVAFQLLALWLLTRQPGYVPTVGPTDLRLAQAPENTVTYLMVRRLVGGPGRGVAAISWVSSVRLLLPA